MDAAKGIEKAVKELTDARSEARKRVLAAIAETKARQNNQKEQSSHQH